MPSILQLRQVVVVGAGVAGTSAAETLREQGYDGALTIVGDERHSPYHRPPLSKKLLTGQVHRAGVDLAPRLDVDARVLRGTSARRLDMSSRTIHLRDGDEDMSVAFDGLVIASGAVPRQLAGGPVPEGVSLLRTVDDCLAIRQRLKSRPRVVVIGGGFIGAEVAASCRSLGLDVTVIEKSLGPNAFRARQRDGAVLGAAAPRTRGGPASRCRCRRIPRQRSRVSGSAHRRFASSRRIWSSSASGVTPATDWLCDSGLKVDDGVVCDATGAVEGGSDVVAAGDVARWWHPLYDQHLRIEHWDHAARQGAAAARTLLAGPDHAEPYCEVPYFWSDQYDVKLQTLGVTTDYDDFTVVEGDPRDWRFVAAYGREGRTVAVLSTIPGRVHAYRDAIAKRAEFPPKPPN